MLVAAGVLSYGLHDLWEAGVLTGGVFDRVAFDVSATIPPSSWYGTLLKGILNFRPDPHVAEVVVYVAYLVPTMYLFFRPARSAPSSPAPAAEPSLSR